MLVTRNIQLKRSAERDIQGLDAFANAEDWQTARERLRNCLELPAVSRRIHIFIDQGRINDFLAQKFRRDVLATRQQQSVHLVHANVVFSRIANVNVRMPHEKCLKPFFVLWSNPGRQIVHRRICDFPPRM